MHLITEGIWLYEGTAPVRVLVEEVDRIPGSGDYEDSEQEREDQMGRFYHISYSAAGDLRICNGRGYFSSPEEAISEAERKFAGIRWMKPAGSDLKNRGDRVP